MASNSPRFTYFCHLIAKIKDFVLYHYIAIRGEASLIKVKKKLKDSGRKENFTSVRKVLKFTKFTSWFPRRNRQQQFQREKKFSVVLTCLQIMQGLLRMQLSKVTLTGVGFLVM